MLVYNEETGEQWEMPDPPTPETVALIEDIDAMYKALAAGRTGYFTGEQRSRLAYWDDFIENL
jgi:hypothetical protein